MIGPGTRVARLIWINFFACGLLTFSPQQWVGCGGATPTKQLRKPRKNLSPVNALASLQKASALVCYQAGQKTLDLKTRLVISLSHQRIKEFITTKEERSP